VINSESSSQKPDHLDQEDEGAISLIEIATTIGLHKKTIVKITGAIVLAAIVVSLLLTPMFTAKTLFVVPTPVQGASAAQMLGNLGGLMGGGGAAGFLGGGKSPDEMYLEFLKTKLIQDALIKELNLQKRYDKSSLEKTEKELKDRTKLTSLKKAGLISVEIDDEDPKFAADLANAYVAQLKEMMQSMALTESGQRKEYYKQELIRARKELDGVTDYRDMKVRESVLAVILNQLEVATLDTARESLIQVAEVAVPPEKKSFPKLGLMVLVSAIGGLLISIFYVLAKKSFDTAQESLQERTRWHQLKASWSIGFKRKNAK
jgi:uncharacterized protein involved in exopolysaccharide biosynthesis